ncbi:hypothetical protein [Kribbella sp. CA-293567]|uniref:hypothetical protein n=1 Tax=Kribbella sp. CA-293567 TaxID=3002436 RepID=UPI0022DDAB9A|nr:hypothetical protein [Kribbella sp. CA-293567]WBQ02949.1 hypothetical protein OX958_23550 [Kribbella sp. CA-293567]
MTRTKLNRRTAFRIVYKTGYAAGLAHQHARTIGPVGRGMLAHGIWVLFALLVVRLVAGTSG